ncbi:tRNA (adenosine(37)-N6)-threonylcarbamoyltransferase complex ATPase subunit type 1 TsaE [Oceanicaulis alexandrii]|uniref:tRNA (adenosine(37)-N6)-threonylcarbamoyltransferase complex ATPase subunit type 1 TsaE n=1 Tax=Oceanicaulis alexandrii TaxID=153233 RepID=UPI0035D0DCA5
MTILTLTLPDPEANARLGARLARLLQPGDAVLLEGGLGAGKTTLARGVIEALTGEKDAPSPTYTLVQPYETDQGLGLLHADLYRLEDPEELDELGLDEALDHGAALIEWPDRMGRWRPADRLEIVLKETEAGGRTARLEAFGSWETRLGGLAD